MNRRALVLAAVLLVSSCSSGPSSSPTTTAAPTTNPPSTACEARSDRTDIAYVDDGDSDPLQRLDLYLPGAASCEAVPVVVWVHGGGWRIGDKTNAMDDKIVLWKDAGWAVASVNYRLTDAAQPEDARIMAPAHNEDVAAAVGWLVDHADELGIDSDRLALLGHSAGAGIVAALAADPTYLGAVGLEPADLGCVAPLDTEAFSIAAAMGGGPFLAEIYEDAFGADPARWEDLSPLAHIGETPTPPLFLVTRGTQQRRQIVTTFADAVEAAGGTATLVDLPAFTHEDVNKRIGDPTDDKLTPELQTFLDACFTR